MFGPAALSLAELVQQALAAGARYARHLHHLTQGVRNQLRFAD